MSNTRWLLSGIIRLDHEDAYQDPRKETTQIRV